MRIYCFTLSLLAIYFLASNTASADVVELTGGLESGLFIDGVNLTQNQLSAAVGGEWSFENGAFVGLNCFLTDKQEPIAIQRGCDASLGWFTLMNEQHALTLSVSRHDYSSPELSGWQYTDASVSWHLGKTYMLKLRASDSLLGQGFSSATMSFHFAKPLSDRWRIGFEAGLTSLQSSAPVNELEYGLMSAQYVQGRWTTELKAMLSSNDYSRFVKLAIDEPEVGLSFRYRLY